MKNKLLTGFFILSLFFMLAVIGDSTVESHAGGAFIFLVILLAIVFGLIAWGATRVILEMVHGSLYGQSSLTQEQLNTTSLASSIAMIIFGLFIAWLCQYNTDDYVWVDSVTVSEAINQNAHRYRMVNNATGEKFNISTNNSCNIGDTLYIECAMNDNVPYCNDGSISDSLGLGMYRHLKPMNWRPENGKNVNQ